MKLTKKDLNYNAMARQEALNAAKKWKEEHTDGVFANNKYWIVVNMHEPSYRKRMYVWDNEEEVFIRNHHTTHGYKSVIGNNRALASSFSNKIGSNKSSLGAMYTGDEYIGKHGRSLILHGLEKGINDNVLKRYIVIHPANYVTDKYILSQGWAGRSNGCLAVDPAISDGLIDLIKNGCYLYVYY